MCVFSVVFQLPIANSEEGDSGLDYHCKLLVINSREQILNRPVGADDHSPRDVQHTVLRKQLRMAIELSKPITIHTREADDDIYAILTDVVPREWNIHVHCFTDSPELGQKLLDYFPNLVFGLTGVLTYTSNTNTSNLLRHMITRPEKPRIVLETDSPFMTPINIPYKELGLKNARSMPVCHSGMITYTAAFAAEVLGQGWTADSVVRLSAEHSKNHYGV